MLRISESDQQPLDANQLVGVTRENGRSFLDYEYILERLKLPALSELGGRTILEIGTGRGAALRGAMEQFGPTAHIVSMDINASILGQISAAPSLPIFHAQAISARCNNERPAIDLIPQSIETASLPQNYFDLSYSIWVLYQVEDKIAAILNTLHSLKTSAPLVVVGGGSVCTVPKEIPAHLLEEIRQYVWNYRASRFSWLNGVRELAHILASLHIPNRIEHLDDFLLRRLHLPAISGEAYPEFPAGSFWLARPTGLPRADGLRLVGSASTRTSALIPVYVDDEYNG